MNRLHRLLPIGLLLLLAIALPPAASAQNDSPEKTIHQIDQFFSGIRSSMREIPQSTLQNWVLITEAFRALNAIISDPKVSSDIAYQARYTQGYGLYVIELYDLAAESQQAAVDIARTNDQKREALNDLAQSYEMAGKFGEAAGARSKGRKLTSDPSLTELNNLALSLLKMGGYIECIRTVNQIDIDKGDVAHTRIFSARAYGFSGKYPEARAELQKACDHHSEDACAMIKRLDASRNAEEYWLRDLANRQDAWQPDNLIDTAHLLRLERGNPVFAYSSSISRFAPSYWFNEIYTLYEEQEGRLNVRYPGTLPAGRMGFILVDGVPFFQAKVSGASEDALFESLRTFVKAIHGPSAWGGSTPATNRLLVAKLPDGNYLALVVHSDWQEEIVRSRTRNHSLDWKRVDP
jgi:tetratricopeptide (TPR) repeat protein